MTQYLIGLVGTQPDFESLSPEDQKQIMVDVDEVVADLQAADAWVFGGGLGGNETASVVDARTGTPVITDGPYAESKEFMGGFSIIEAPDLPTAQQWAARFSVACRCAQEVRPIFGPPDEA